MIHFKIEDSDAGWLHVELNSATEMSFDVMIPQQGYQELFDRLCAFAPIAMRLDADLMEAYDDAGRTNPSPGHIAFVRTFAGLYVFKNVNCALPGFDQLPPAYQGASQGGDR